MFRIIGGDRQEYGPVSTDELREWIAEGRADGQTLVQRPGTQGWQPLSTVPELATLLSSSSSSPPPLPRLPDSTSDPVTAIIPYKNMPALISYYLAIFSLIPCLGIVLGLAAVVFGIIGLKRARERPEARGKIHAWVGIVLGGLFGFGYLVAVILLMSAGARYR